MKMKNLLAILLVVASLNGFAQQKELTWHTDVNKAINLSLQQEKPLFFFFTGSDWCGWCIKLQQQVFFKKEFKTWADKNVILVAPHFTKDNYPYYSTLGMATHSGKLINDRTDWLRNSISSFHTFFRSRYNLNANKYRMFGFSGGSQFVHRYLMYGVDSNIEKAAIGSAGWYTFLDYNPFPYGIKNMPLEPGRVEWLMSKEVLFLLILKGN